MGLLGAYANLQAAGRGTWEYDAEATALRKALLALPCDGVVDPGQAAGTARRALASLPERSVFASVKRCRAALLAAVSTAERILHQT